MSMIEREIKNLEKIREELATNMELDCDINDYKDVWIKYITSAIDTIKTQSEKIHAYAMERSSQYYHDGWIPCDERTPEAYVPVLVCYEDNHIGISQIEKDGAWKDIHEYSCTTEICDMNDIVAWRYLPEPYGE